jgi:predicted dithiol-disulfide oxidoreductase (DUF899 family)
MEGGAEMPAKTKAKAKTNTRTKTKASAKTKARTVSKPLHAERFPGEGKAYRSARDKLLRAEMELRNRVEQVAAMRRTLPLGGVVPQDYEFEEGAADLADTGSVRRVKLSELFRPGKDTLVVYSFMYGPNMAKACPMCTCMLDGLDGNAPHAAQRINLAVVAKSPIARIREYARGRGWRNLRLLSSAGNSYNRDYRGETADGKQFPSLNVFVKRGDTINHVYNTKLAFARRTKGQEPRHVDAIWPLWNLFDFTPDGRGADWHPKLEYPI